MAKKPHQKIVRKKTKQKNKKGLIIEFNKDLYNLKSIKSAIKAYQHLADFSFKNKAKYIQVELNNIDQEIKSIIKDEFCNYVFFLMKS